jgi:hypothetical protein
MCLRLKNNKLGYGFVGVSPPTGPMHLISTLSLQAGHTSRKIEGLMPQILQVKF